MIKEILLLGNEDLYKKSLSVEKGEMDDPAIKADTNARREEERGKQEVHGVTVRTCPPLVAQDAYAVPSRSSAQEGDEEQKPGKRDGVRVGTGVPGDAVDAHVEGRE